MIIISFKLKALFRVEAFTIISISLEKIIINYEDLFVCVIMKIVLIGYLTISFDGIDNVSGYSCLFSYLKS